MTKMLNKLKLGTHDLFGCTIWRSPERLPHTTASEQPVIQPRFKLGTSVLPWHQPT